MNTKEPTPSPTPPRRMWPLMRHLTPELESDICWPMLVHAGRREINRRLGHSEESHEQSSADDDHARKVNDDLLMQIPFW